MHLLFCLYSPQVHKIPRDASRPSQPPSHLTVYRISYLTRSRRPQLSSPTHPLRHSSQSKSGVPSPPQPLHICLGWPRGERSRLLWEGPGTIELPRLWARSGPGWREKMRTALLLPPDGQMAPDPPSRQLSYSRGSRWRGAHSLRVRGRRRGLLPARRASGQAVRSKGAWFALSPP